MARHSVRGSSVQELVRQLVGLVVETGSVNGAGRALNEALERVGQGTKLHPNRLHALLSDDIARGVNDATLVLFEQALANHAPAISEDARLERLLDVRRRALTLREGQGADLSAIADALKLPRAVVRVALFADADGLSEFPEAGLLRTAAPVAIPHAPDWSFQDTAVRRTLDCFKRRPAGRIGLILPTGAGKTRVALRVILERLAQSPVSARVLWVTHRRALRRQAYRQLRKLIKRGAPLPADPETLANRIRFAMVAEASGILDELGSDLTLIVVDEAHHAAATSYRPLFEPRLPCPVLLLTATPNRPDQLPIHVEEIAFTITYRELADRGVIIIPEFLPLPVDDFEWDDAALDDLVDRLVDETAGRFGKVLVLFSRVDRVVKFYNRLVDRLAGETAHPLALDEVGYIHGGGNSLGVEDEDFLARFEALPRAVLVSADMLLEGFDDPSIDTVVLTYPTSSIIRLMQAAGRAVRQADGKSKAYVLQVDNPGLAYRFDQRWLYQEIDDRLRPELVDVTFGSVAERYAKVEALLQDHHVAAAAADGARAVISTAGLDDDVRILFYGVPYYGAPDAFRRQAPWGVFVETAQNRSAFRRAFNDFCALGANLSDPTDFLTRLAPEIGVVQDLSPGSLWRSLSDILIAAYAARDELSGQGSPGLQGGRPRTHHGPTSWLRYVTLRFEPVVPPALTQFLADCYNRSALEAEFLAEPSRNAGAVKIPLPVGGAEGLLLPADALSEIESRLTSLTIQLRTTAPEARFSALASALATAPAWPWPAQFTQRVEALLGDAGQTNLFRL